MAIGSITMLGALSIWVLVGLWNGGSVGANAEAGPVASRPVPQALPLQVRSPPSPPAAPSPTPRPGLVPNTCPKKAVACVDIRLRLAWLQHGGHVVYGPVPVMPGTAGAKNSVATPVGIFHVSWKDADHVSGEFGEPMNNAVFFAPGGIAFHQGSLVSSSHGCVHLSKKDSQHFFGQLQQGDEVAVFRSRA